MELFSRNHLLGTIEASSQDDVFRALAARAVELGAARSADDIVADYHEREAEASTGFGGGVAIPHSKTDNVSDAILLFARLRHPIFGYTRWNVLGRLVDAHRITSAEADLIRERERAGKRLNVKGIAFPHAITPVESDGFRLFVACLDEPVTDMDATIGLIIVVLASQSQADKSSIFTYLLSVIEDATARSESLPRTYEETLRYLGSV